MWHVQLLGSGYITVYFCDINHETELYINRLVQERRNSRALAMELRLSCTNPSISNARYIINFNTKNIAMFYALFMTNPKTV